MKKVISLMCALLLVLLAGCDKGDDKGAAVSVPEPAPAETSLPMEADDYDEDYLDEEEVSIYADTVIAADNGDSYIEIPFLSMVDEAEELPPGAEEMNQAILDFCEGYEDYLEVREDGAWCEIQTGIMDPYEGLYAGLIQTMIHVNFYPTYGTDGEVMIFTYDTLTDTFMTPDDVVAAYDIDTSVATDVLAEEGTFGEGVHVIGYDLVGVAHMDVGIQFIYQVYTVNEEDSEYSWLVACNEDGELEFFSE